MRKIYFFFFLCYSIGLLAQMSLNPAERSALIQLFHSTDGTHWNNTWDLNKSPDTWFGITIKNGSVTRIQLSANHLKGAIPPAISAFQNLEVLDLGSNQLSGELPSSLSFLSHLKYLDLSHNLLKGDAEVVKSLSELEELSIGYNQLTINDINGFVGSFKNLKSLDIAFCGVATLPSNFNEKSQLEKMDISGNPITSGFEVFTQLKSLKQLSLSKLNLEKIPSSVSALSQLSLLDLSENSISDFSSLRSLENLEWLSLENNRLESIPMEVTALRKLVHINLNHNKLTTLSALSNLKNLEQIFANRNVLEGNFPEYLLNLPKLQMISLVSNQLSGELPLALPAVTLVQNNRYTLAQLKALLPILKDKYIEYSPQRYDTEAVVKVESNNTATLTQSLSAAEGYTFTWLKSLEQDMRSHFESHHFDKIKDEDFTLYTCEAYYQKKENDVYFEISFFREPIALESNTLNTDENPLKSLKIHPNPAKDFIMIDIENLDLKKASIYDMSGKKLMESTSKKVDVRALPSAVYVMIVETDMGIKSFKVLKY